MSCAFSELPATRTLLVIDRAGMLHEMKRPLITEAEYRAARAMKKLGRPREYDRPSQGVDGRMLDEDGFVRPEFREHVARLRERPAMSTWGELAEMATARANQESDE